MSEDHSYEPGADSQVTASMSGASVHNGEAHVPADTFRGKADTLIGSVEPDELLCIQPHAYAAAGVSITHVDSEPVKSVMLQIAQVVFVEEIPIDLHDSCRADLDQLDPRRIAEHVRSKVHDPGLEPVPDNGDLKTMGRRLNALTVFSAGSSALKSELERHAEAAVSAICRGMLDRFSRSLGRAPRAVGSLVCDVSGSVTQKSAVPFDCRPALQKAQRLLKRHKSVLDLGDELTSEIRKRLQVRFMTEERNAINAAIGAVVAQHCHVAVRRVISRFVDRLRLLASEARALERRQQLVFETLAPGRSGHGSMGIDDESGGRAVTLPGRDAEELRQRILARRGCQDLEEAARAYREELGPAVAPKTENDAIELGLRIRRLIAADCESESIYNSILDRETAITVAAELYSRAHPFVSLRLASEELGVCLARYEHVELPLADDNPAHVEARRAIQATLHNLSGGRIRVIDQAADVAVIRVLRTVCGYPSVCDQTNAPLRAGYEEIVRLLDHDAHPLRSGLPLEENGRLKLNGSNGMGQ